MHPIINAATRISVLMYHRVGISHNEWEARYAISPVLFAAHMHHLASKGFRAISIDSLVDWLEGGLDLPDRAILVTFDDGFRGVYDHALPVLEDLGWPFTVFLVSDLIGKEDIWTRSENPDGKTYPLLDKVQILDMQRRGVSFQSHTRSHTKLPTLNETQLADQLTGSRLSLSALLEQDVQYLAYPFGHLDDRVERATRTAGYRAAFSTQPGFNRRDMNLFRIRRIDVYGTDSRGMLLRKITYGSNNGGIGQSFSYYLNRVKARIAGAVR